jgi:hypothetical protein
MLEFLKQQVNIMTDVVTSVLWSSRWLFSDDLLSNEIMIPISKKQITAISLLYPNNFITFTVAQKSVTQLVNYTLKYVANFFIINWIYTNCWKWDPPCLVAQLTTLWHRSANWLATLNLKCFRLTGFWASLCIITISLPHPNNWDGQGM